ncbi:MAG: NADH-quinone oxidoreductase subunit C [Balneolaceae bacterium]|nr:NADH-quinone oxidoreductase subunit C [Balneolaceae bacterium]
MKNTEQIVESLTNAFGESAITFEPEGKVEPWIRVEPGSIVEVSRYLRDDPELRLDTLCCLSGVHYPDDEQYGVTYHLHSTKKGHSLTLKVRVSEEDPRVPSVESIWKTANWHEREAFDMFGIIFENHPDLRRILCPDDWEGHPLRKDYRQADSYRGMKIPY